MINNIETVDKNEPTRRYTRTCRVGSHPRNPASRLALMTRPFWSGAVHGTGRCIIYKWMHGVAATKHEVLKSTLTRRSLLLRSLACMPACRVRVDRRTERCCRFYRVCVGDRRMYMGAHCVYAAPTNRFLFFSLFLYALGRRRSRGGVGGNGGFTS